MVNCCGCVDRCADVISQTMKDSQIHLILTAVWVMLIIPTLLWWRDSILWIAFMSLYANIAGHWAAYEGAKAKEGQS